MSRGTLLLPITWRFTEYSAVITRMPLSKLLILNLVCSRPVAMPARTPAPKPASVARAGETWCTSSVAVTAAPSVMEPSAVMSGKLKMRKLR